MFKDPGHIARLETVMWSTQTMVHPFSIFLTLECASIALQSASLQSFNLQSYSDSYSNVYRDSLQKVFVHELIGKCSHLQIVSNLEED